MRRGVRVACALAAGIGLLASACGGKHHRAAPSAGGYAQPSPAAPESSPPTGKPSWTGAPSFPEPSAPSPPSTEAPRSPAPQPPPPGFSPTPSAGPLEIRAEKTRFGRVLVDGRGMTIYVAARDNADFESTCHGPCTREWPPLYTNGQVTAGPGVNSAWLGTIGRTDGPIQVEYNGWPLYYSSRDREPGDMKGRRVTAFGTTWHVIDADKGQKVK